MFFSISLRRTLEIIKFAKESKAVIVVFSFKYPLLKSFNARETISLLFLFDHSIEHSA